MNIVISGASKGIGYAIAERFAQEATAHTFFLCSRTLSQLQSAIETLTSQYPQHTYHGYGCDVANEEQVKTFVTSCLSQTTSIDLLVNNAGFGMFKPTEEFSASEFNAVIDTNLKGVFWLTKGLLPAMRTNKKGTIVTLSSLAGKSGFKGGSAYCAAKYAVRGLMQCLFLEVREDNIRCLTVCPGSVDTAFFDNITNPGTTTNMLQAAEIAEIVYQSCSLPHSATVSEIEIRPTNPKGR